MICISTGVADQAGRASVLIKTEYQSHHNQIKSIFLASADESGQNRNITFPAKLKENKEKVTVNPAGAKKPFLLCPS